MSSSYLHSFPCRTSGDLHDTNSSWRPRTTTSGLDGVGSPAIKCGTIFTSRLVHKEFPHWIEEASISTKSCAYDRHGHILKTDGTGYFRAHQVLQWRPWRSHSLPFPWTWRRAHGSRIVVPGSDRKSRTSVPRSALPASRLQHTSPKAKEYRSESLCWNDKQIVLVARQNRGPGSQKKSGAMSLVGTGVSAGTAEVGHQGPPYPHQTANGCSALKAPAL